MTLAFATQVLPEIERKGMDLDVYYVASAELFDALPEDERQRIFPESLAQEAMGITGFTLPTMYRWVRSDRGRAATLHPYRQGHFPGSGQGQAVLHEAGLDAEGQFRAIQDFIDVRARRR